MQSKSTAAFFDFDKTLLDIESSRLGIRYLHDLGLLSFGFILKVMVANFLYTRHLLSDERMAAILLKIYRGRKLADFRAGASDFYTSVLEPHLAPRILERLHWHQSEGHLTVLVSGSLRYMLEPVAADHHIAYLICSDLEEGPDGLLTGKLSGPICMGDHKRILVKRLATEIDIDLGASYAYGDHHSDLPLLEAVGFPYAVEPNRRLMRIAVQRKWPILAYR